MIFSSLGSFVRVVVLTLLLTQHNFSRCFKVYIMSTSIEETLYWNEDEEKQVFQAKMEEEANKKICFEKRRFIK